MSISSIAALLAAAVPVISKDLHEVRPHLPQEHSPHVVPLDYEERSTMIMESSGAMKSSSSMVRREEHASFDEQASLAEDAALEETDDAPQKATDAYVLAGANLCDGGGLWKRYELHVVLPGNYQYCSAACDEKDECIGFDFGLTGCNLYSQKAVAIGTWGDVRFNGVDAFHGKGVHNAFPQTPYDLTVGKSSYGKINKFKCYRKTFYKPAASYYWKIGSGNCGGGGLWRRYKMTPGDYNKCSHACNQRDECIGFDHGTWKDAGKSCNLYVQKEVFGHWPGVESPSLVGQGKHKGYASKPSQLVAAKIDQYDTKGDAACWAKTHWVSLSSFYMELGKGSCAGGGLWKHYRMSTASISACKAKCDEKPECVGIDFAKPHCRLFTQREVQGDWKGVRKNKGKAFAGGGAHNIFAPDAGSLSPGNHHRKDATCLAKTHIEPPPASKWLKLKGQPTSQSSTVHRGDAKRAIDGNANTRYFAHSCTHTDLEDKAWWQVDLGQKHTIEAVKVTNRGDCCGSRLNPFDVLLDGKPCATGMKIKQGRTGYVKCEGTGQVIRLQLQKKEALTICEFQVKGAPTIAPAPQLAEK